MPLTYFTIDPSPRSKSPIVTLNDDESGKRIKPFLSMLIVPGNVFALPDSLAHVLEPIIHLPKKFPQLPLIPR